MKKILILGSGGREHALYHKLRKSPSCSEVHVTPGNAGIDITNCISSCPPLEEKQALRKFIEKQAYDMVVVGPEEPLAKGICDILSDTCAVFGPTKAAAQLEASKNFAKEFMKKYSIPTAKFQYFNHYDDAMEYVQNNAPPFVIKADGLAAGKGVSIVDDLPSAELVLKNLMQNKVLGEAGTSIIIEEKLEGEEMSVFAICDGTNGLLFPPAQDHKRAFDGDKGPNTGGMGAYLPVNIATDSLQKEIHETIVQPTLDGLRQEGYPYRGLLYVGLMIDKKNQAKVIEFNVRFGDPETQPLLCLLGDDLCELMWTAATQKFTNERLALGLAKSTNPQEQAAICVVLAAQGYPLEYAKGIDLRKYDARVGQSFDGLQCFHAGTYWDSDGILRNSGGRVLHYCLTGENCEQVSQQLYASLDSLRLNGLFYRKDIAFRAIKNKINTTTK